MKNILALFAITFSINSYALNGKEFVECFEKAINERIEEIKKESPKVKICDKLSSRDMDRLYELYSFISEGRLYYYSDKAMNAENVRFHYERIMYEIECYKNPNNIFTAFAKGLGDAVGVYDHTNFTLVKDAMTKVLGRKMWTENGSDKFSEHKFEYCQL